MAKQLSRKKKLAYNSISSLVYQLVLVVASLILPRLFMSHYGSATNGLISSITQFLSFISLCECGVGAVVQSSLYKPLAQDDSESISKIFVSARNFFRKIAYILLAYILILLVFYPLIVKDFSYLYTATLILTLSISLFAQYYFGIVYRLILSADQKAYITTIAATCTTILNITCSVILIKHDVPVQLVKLTTSLIFLIQPLVAYKYVTKHYAIDKNIKFEGEPIKQKWNGLAQHVAAVVLGNTDVTVLTLFSTLKNVSIYSTYNLVATGLKTMLYAFTSGFSSMLGNMLANKEYKTLEKTFESYEWFIHTVVTGMYAIAGILLVPFVKVYTQGITDANYIQPVFSFLLILSVAINCIRLPYNSMVLAAGHYKQTQTSAIIEASLNIACSILFVFKFGLLGVALATVIALTYRTIYFAYYLNRKTIFNYSVESFWKHVIVDIITTLVIIYTTKSFGLEALTYASWGLMVLKVLGVGIVDCLVINFVLYKKTMLEFFQIVLGMLKHS